MSSGQCLITGCEFLDVPNQRWIHGDLHQLLDILIFNANGCEWYDCLTTPLNPEAMMVRADHFYEKNNQLVFPLAISVFNEHAHRYLTGMMREEEKHIITLDKLQ